MKILRSIDFCDLRVFPSVPADIWPANTPNLAYNQTMLPLFFSSICWLSSFSSPYFVTSTPVYLIINLKFSGTSTATVLGRLKSILRGRRRWQRWQSCSIFGESESIGRDRVSKIVSNLQFVNVALVRNNAEFGETQQQQRSVRKARISSSLL